jgi:DNA-binding NarL/FixJ family response regulator
MSIEKAIRVLVIDDSEAIRRSLFHLLSAFPDFQWQGESPDGCDALVLCARLQPDVVLLAVSLRYVDSANITRLIREHFPTTQVIGISGFDEPSFEVRVLAAGAAVCLSKNANIMHFAATVRQVANLRNALNE